MCVCVCVCVYLLHIHTVQILETNKEFDIPWQNLLDSYNFLYLFPYSRSVTSTLVIN
jgi:hypothetical protein